MKTLHNQNAASVTIFLVTMCFLYGCTKITTSIKPKTVKTPVITGFNISAALPNSVISVLGNNFDTVWANNAISFNGVAATIISVNTAEMVVTVPATAITGKVKLVNSGVSVSSAVDFKILTGTVSAFGKSFTEHTVVDATGNFYEESTNGISKTSPAGIATNVIAKFYFPHGIDPWGLAMDKSGNLYVVNQSGSPGIIKVTPGGVISIFAGGTVPGFKDGPGSSAQFQQPVGIAIDGAGNLYVNDYYRVRKITPNAVVSTLAGSGIAGDVNGQATGAQFGHTEGIAVDASGNVYVADKDYYKIKKITASGKVTTLAGSGSKGLADGSATTSQFYYPQGMAVDAAGNVFVSDSNLINATTTIFSFVKMINKAGVVTTFLKGNSPLQINHGPLSTADVSVTDGLFFDSSGNMYICNTFASEISKVTFN